MANDKNVKLIISAKDQATSTIKGIERGFTSLKDSVFSMQGALSAVGITATLASATRASNAAEAANIGLAVSARYAGQSIDGTLQAAQALTQDGLLTMTEASMGLKNLLSRGFSLDEATTLMNRFKDSAAFGRQASLGFGEAIVSATEGLKNENSILVDNAGVTKNVSVMWKEYALSIGTTADKLTQAQKREAEYQGVLIETDGQLGNAARSAETAAGMQAKLGAETLKTQEKLGNALNPAVIFFGNILTTVVGGMGDFIGGLQMMAVESAGFMDKIEALGGFDTVGVLFGDASFEQEKAKITARFAEINQIVEEQKQEIFDKATKVTAPDIGKDSGARRKDIVVPAAPPKVAAQGDKYDAAAVDKQMWIDAQEARNTAYAEGQTYRRQAEADERAQNLQAHHEHEATLKEMELDSIRSRVDAWVAGEEKKAQALQWYTEQEKSMRLNAANNAIGLLGVLGQKSKAAALIAMATQRGLMIGETYTSGLAAQIRALAELGPIAGPPAASAIMGWTYLNMGLIGATGIAQATMGGGSGSSTQGAGTSTSPIVTQPAASADSNKLPGGLTIVINGPVMENQKWFEEVLAPSIKELVGRNVDFGMQPA